MRALPACVCVGVSALVACSSATTGGGDGPATGLAAALAASFKATGQAGLDRLQQDETQRTCSAARGRPLPADASAKLERANLATIRYPADGKFLGDWRNGERIAQEGRGKQFSDDPNAAVGANCYACHRLSSTELSFGTLGPSLYQYGKLRGNSPEVQRYTFAKIYNAQAFAACSSMPRFGHNGILSEQQIQDVTALLLDPGSPVNE